LEFCLRLSLQGGNVEVVKLVPRAGGPMNSQQSITHLKFALRSNSLNFSPASFAGPVRPMPTPRSVAMCAY